MCCVSKCVQKYTWGGAPKNAWGQIAQHIASSATASKFGAVEGAPAHYILLHNAQRASTELLDVLCEQMRPKIYMGGVRFYFIMLTTQLGFIPQNIRSMCVTVRVKRPTKSQYADMLLIDVAQEHNARILPDAYKQLDAVAKHQLATNAIDLSVQQSDTAIKAQMGVSSIKLLFVHHVHFILSTFAPAPTQFDVDVDTAATQHQLKKQRGGNNTGVKEETTNIPNDVATLKDAAASRKIMVCKSILDAIVKVPKNAPLNLLTYAPFCTTFVFTSSAWKNAFGQCCPRCAATSPSHPTGTRLCYSQ